MLICCKKSSSDDSGSRRLSRLHTLSHISRNSFSKSGFTLLEVLIVVLTIGIISATAVGSYSGVIQNTRIQSAKDRLEVFLRANKNKAKFRKLDIKLVYNSQLRTIQDPSSTANFLRVPELYQPGVPRLIEIDKSGTFRIMGQARENLELSIHLPGSKLATITVKL